MSPPIPLSQPDITQSEIDAVVDVLHSSTLSIGPKVEEFESRVAAMSKRRHAVAVSSGTAGLHCAMIAAGIGPGDDVVTTPFSFVASANCVLYEGATPVFADIDPRTLNLDPAAVEAALTPRTKAIVAVDIFGYPCELGPLRELCDRHGLFLIEDSCEALGAEYDGEPVGSHGHPAVFAFYPNKQMTTGEGGVVVTGSEEKWRLLKSLSNQGRAEEAAWLDHERLGYNYRLNDIAAAIGIAQLEKLDLILELRGRVATRYAELLAGFDGAEPLAPDDADHKRSWFVYPVRLAEDVDRDQVLAELRAAGVASKVYLPS